MDNSTSVNNAPNNPPSPVSPIEASSSRPSSIGSVVDEQAAGSVLQPRQLQTPQASSQTNPHNDSPVTPTSSPSTSLQTIPNVQTPQAHIKVRSPWLSSWWWWWELGAALLSMTSMLLIIVILFKVQDKPLQSWGFSIQPNSLIAVLTTVGKTAMLLAVAESISQLKWRYFRKQARPLNRFQEFDDASRGPWGSFVLLCGTRGRTVLASLGAFITIISLGIEPTAQQILAFPSRNETLTNMTAPLGRADAYYSSALQSSLIDNVVATNSNLLQLQTAIVNGIVGRVSAPDFTCPVEAVECRWPSFKSLGICGSCEDVSSSVTSNCSAIPPPSNTIICDYNAPQFQSVDDTRTEPWSDDTIVRMMYDPQTIPQVANKSTLFATFISDDKYSGIISVKALSELVGVSKNASANAPPVQVHHCSWDWCERTYTEVTAIPGSIQKNTSTSEYLTRVQAVSDAAGNVVLELIANSTGQMYNVTKISDDQIWRTITALLDVIVYKQDSRTSNTMGTTLDLGGYLYGGSLSTIGEDIAITLTSQIRSQSMDNPNATTIQGTVRIKETYVKVRWPWLILPLVETILASFLLVMSIFTSAGCPPWKSSAIAPLVHGLDGWNDDELVVKGHESVGGLERLAKSMTVVLGRNGDGYLKLGRV